MIRRAALMVSHGVPPGWVEDTIAHLSKTEPGTAADLERRADAARRRICPDGRVPEHLLTLPPAAPVEATADGARVPVVEARPPRPGEMPDDMVTVPAGSFWMGCNERVDADCADDERPGRRVHLGGYRIDRTEVTIAAWRTCVEAGGCTEPLSGEAFNWGREGRDDHPIDGVRWEQARDFCSWLGKRLPTEAQWEKAARGTDGRRYPWGNEPATCELAVFNEDGGDGCGRGSAWPVGSRPAGASPYGTLDMTGSVWEWTADYYAFDWYGHASDTDPTGPSSGQYRVRRGGGAAYPADIQRSSFRYGHIAGPAEKYRVGLRCVRPGLADEETEP